MIIAFGCLVYAIEASLLCSAFLVYTTYCFQLSSFMIRARLRSIIMFSCIRKLFSRKSRRIIPEIAGDDEEKKKPTTASVLVDDEAEKTLPLKVSRSCSTEEVPELTSSGTVFLGHGASDVAASRFDPEAAADTPAGSAGLTGSFDRPMSDADALVSHDDRFGRWLKAVETYGRESEEAQRLGRRSLVPRVNYIEMWKVIEDRPAPEPEPEDEPEVNSCCCPCLVPMKRSIALMFERSSQSRRDRRRDRRWERSRRQQ